MNPIKAKLLVTRKRHKCECCNKKWPSGSRLWKETNTDCTGAERGPFYFCIKCPGEQETRKEQRRALNDYLNDDPG